MLAWSVAPRGALAATRPATLEQDAGFFFRTALGLHRNTEAETPRIFFFKSPRSVDKNIADQVVSIMLAAAGGTPAIQESEVLEKVAEKLSYFKTFAPIKVDNTSDQYFLDVKLFSLYQLVAKRLPSSEERVAFRERVGDGILDSIIARRPSLPLSGSSQVDIARGVNAILCDFESSGLIKSFSFDADDFGDERFAQESLSQGQAVSTEIQLTEPCNVLSFIEGVKENTFFHPEFVGTTLAQYIRRCGRRYDARFEDYLLDNFSTESNVDVRAQDVVLELRMGTRQTFPT